MRKIQAISGLVIWIVATNLQGATPDPKVALVAGLYREFAWEVVITEPQGTTFLLQSEAVLSRYLTPTLLQLLMKERACATERKEICSLGFTPIWDGNDPAAVGLRVLPGARPNEVSVRFTAHSKRAVEIYYDLVQVNGSWRIDNIRTKDWSLVSILQDPL